MSEVRLFSYAACPFAQRTRMALIEKQIEFSLTEIDVYNKPEGWSELSPYGKVPLLIHHGERVYESSIINEYLEEAFPAHPLMPTDPLLRARLRIWSHYCDNYYLAATSALVKHRDDPAQLAESRVKLDEVFRFIEFEGLRKLSDGPFWMGDQIGLTDIVYSPFLERFPSYTELWGVEIPVDCSRIHGWLSALQDRESYRQTASDAEDHLAGLKQRIGLAA